MMSAAPSFIYLSGSLLSLSLVLGFISYCFVHTVTGNTTAYIPGRLGVQLTIPSRFVKVLDHIHIDKFTL